MIIPATKLIKVPSGIPPRVACFLAINPPTGASLGSELSQIESDIAIGCILRVYPYRSQHPNFSICSSFLSSNSGRGGGASIRPFGYSGSGAIAGLQKWAKRKLWTTIWTIWTVCPVKVAHHPPLSTAGLWPTKKRGGGGCFRLPSCSLFSTFSHPLSFFFAPQRGGFFTTRCRSAAGTGSFRMPPTVPPRPSLLNPRFSSPSSHPGPRCGPGPNKRAETASGNWKCFDHLTFLRFCFVQGFAGIDEPSCRLLGSRWWRSPVTWESG